jgi:hypothetical protein
MDDHAAAVRMAEELEALHALSPLERSPLLRDVMYPCVAPFLYGFLMMRLKCQED